MDAVETVSPMNLAPCRGAGTLATEPRFLYVRLSALIFCTFAIIGSWVPTLSLYLETLGFSPDATAWVLSTNALGAMIAPLPWGQIADRWLATERCISFCALVSAILLLCLATVTDPLVFILLSLVVWFFLIPVLSLTGSFIFRQLEHPDREYGPIRLWGTVGWMAASWGLTIWFTLAGHWLARDVDFADSLRLGALAALIVAVYAWTLPHAPPSRSDSVERPWLARMADAPLGAVRLLLDRSFFVYCACMLGLYITLPFTIQLNPLFLRSLGVDAALVSTCLTIAQTTEVLLLALLPILLQRLGLKTTMVIGSVAWSLGLALMSLGAPLWLVLAALATAGFFICCFVISGQVFVHRQASSDIRASAQGFLVFINGSGLFLGNLLVGRLRAWSGDQFALAYGIAAIVAVGLTVLFTLAFVPVSTAETPQDVLVPDADLP